MALKLTKADIKARDAMIAKLLDARVALAEAVDTYNAAIGSAAMDLQQAATTFNQVLDEAREFIDVLHEQKSEEFDNRSDAWRASEKGEAAGQWLATIAGQTDELMDWEFSEPAEADADVTPDPDDVLRDIPEAPGAA